MTLKGELVAFIAKVKVVVFENLLGAMPPHPFLFNLTETEGRGHFPPVSLRRLYIEAFHTVLFVISKLTSTHSRIRSIIAHIYGVQRS